ncbi:hypothetical protein [Azospirillum doebereinerae]
MTPRKLQKPNDASGRGSDEEPVRSPVAQGTGRVACQERMAFLRCSERW